jgi:hypothetical protein
MVHCVAVWEGVQGPIMLHMYLSFSEVLFVDLQINPFRPRPSHPAIDSQSFRFGVNIFSPVSLTMGHEQFSSLGPKPDLRGPVRL